MCVCMYICVCVCIYAYTYTYIYIYTYTYTYTYIYIYTELEIGSIASPNAHHFWGNYESLWQSALPNFFGTANHFWTSANHISNGIAKRPFFGSLPFF